MPRNPITDQTRQVMEFLREASVTIERYQVARDQALARLYHQGFSSRELEEISGLSHTHCLNKAKKYIADHPDEFPEAS